MTDWSKPQEVDDALMVFPGSVKHLMPSREECEKGLSELKKNGEPWREFQRRWFYDGLPDKTVFKTDKDIDLRTAIRHLSCIQGSFEPKHEHKEAAVAYLSSLWFLEVPS